METTLIYELIGYLASILVAISLMMSAIVKLRIVNMIGAFTFSVYGILIGSIPVAAMNGFIVLINIYYLVQIYKDKDFFRLLRIHGESEYLKEFLNFHRESIHTFQPDFTVSKNHNFTLFVLRNMIPAGLVLGNLDENGKLAIDLDYVIPDYRDFKIGNYLFNDKVDYFINQGVRTITTPAGSKAHNYYLEKVGFARSTTDSGQYQQKLTELQ